MKKVKVGHFVCRMEYGGVEAVIANYFSGFDKNLYEMHIITQSINDEGCIRSFEQKGFIVHKVTHKRVSILRNIIDIIKLLRRERFDVVHSHMNLTNFYVLFLAQLFRTKVRISHSHSAIEPNSKLKKVLYRVISYLNRITATDYLACGVDAAMFLFGRAYEQGKVSIFNNVIESTYYEYNPKIRERVRKELDIRDSLCIGHVGRFMEVKNHLFIIELFQRYHKKNPNSILLLIGDGETRQTVQERVRAYALDDVVIFTGNIKNVNEYYQAMDVFVLPSLFEGLPVVSVEAQCAGLPCLISDKVDTHCKMSENVMFISITDVTLWVSAILGIDTTMRKSGVPNITANHYNLEEEVIRMEHYYADTLKR